MIRFAQEVCANLEQACQQEWLETNGIGGFASSTITGLNTRCSHGLLTAPAQTQVGRFVLLSKMEETLLIDGRHYDLSANQYPGTVYPQGYRYLQEFRLDPFPVFVYRVDGIEIEKRVVMIHGEHTTVIDYQVNLPSDARECTLELRPLLAFRDYQSTTHHNDAIRRTVTASDGMASISPYEGLPTLYFGHNAQSLAESGNWYFNFEYSAELERGFAGHEDLFNPFVLSFALKQNGSARVIASTDPRAASQAPSLIQDELRRRKEQADSSPASDPAPQPSRTTASTVEP